MSYLINNITIITQNKKREIIDRGYIVIEGGFIKLVGHGCFDKKTTGVYQEIEGEGLFALPGFVNTHVHLGESIYKNFIQENFNLEEYLEQTNELTKKTDLFERSRELITSYSIYNLLKYGCTTICGGRTREAAQKWKMRNLSGYMMMNSYKLKKYLIDIEKQFIKEKKRCGKDPNCKSAIFIHSLNKIPIESLNVVSGLMKKYHNLLLMIHVAETSDQEIAVINRWKKSSVEVLDDYGLLGKNSLLVHCNCISKNDILKIKRKKSILIHCPSSNANVADMILDVNSVIAKGINICVATDGVVTSRTYSPLEEIKKLLTKGQDSKLNIQKVLDLITIAPAKAIKEEQNIGSIEDGKSADIIFFSKKKVNNSIKYVNLESLINSVKDAKVFGLIKNGLIIIWKNKFCSFDEKNLLAEYKGLIKRIKEDINESDFG